tara:strand:- start:340 stop:711 length:372 start_codon:yes stop_codon:yes gene_type:complete
MARVRTTLEIEYDGQVRDLMVTFNLIDRIGGIIRWEELAVEFDKENPIPNFSVMAKFVYHNLKAAGFKVTDDDLSDIYDEILVGDDRESYIQLVGKLLAAYMPQGSKKKSVTTTKKAPTKKAS